MKIGIAFVLAACFIWGLIFVVPQYMSGFSAIEVVLGRYLVYGLISSIIFLKTTRQKPHTQSRKVWKNALRLSFAATIGYYTCVVLSLRYAAPADCALILGVGPVVIAFYGNWKQKEIPNKNLIFPSFLILLGLAIINVPHFEETANRMSYLFGITCAILALLSFSWFIVANDKFLKNHRTISPADWSTIMGVSALFWVTIFTASLTFFFNDQLEIEKYTTPSDELTQFIIGSCILGILCSWVGGYLWNKAGPYLPISLSGQLTIFETIFGLIFVYSIENTLPQALEAFGIVILLIAVVYAINQFTKKRTPLIIDN